MGEGRGTHFAGEFTDEDEKCMNWYLQEEIMNSKFQVIFFWQPGNQDPELKNLKSKKKTSKIFVVWIVQ